MSNIKNSVFEFERLLKFLLSYISEEQASALRYWRSNERRYTENWNSFVSIKNTHNAKQVEINTLELFKIECVTMDTIATIFEETPDPKKATGLWDAGRLQSTLKERESAILGINEIVSELYTFVRKNTLAIKELMLNEKSMAVENDDAQEVTDTLEGNATTENEDAIEGEATTEANSAASNTVQASSDNPNSVDKIEEKYNSVYSDPVESVEPNEDDLFLTEYEYFDVFSDGYAV